MPRFTFSYALTRHNKSDLMASSSLKILPALTYFARCKTCTDIELPDSSWRPDARTRPRRIFFDARTLRIQLWQHRNTCWQRTCNTLIFCLRFLLNYYSRSLAIEVAINLPLPLSWSCKTYFFTNCWKGLLSDLRTHEINDTHKSILV